MIDIGVITGSGIYELPADRELRVAESALGKRRWRSSASGRGQSGASPAMGGATITFPTRSLTGQTSCPLSGSGRGRSSRRPP